MHTFDIEPTLDMYTDEPSSIVRVILSKDNQILDIIEYDPDTDNAWTESEIINTMKGRNSVTGEICITRI